MYYIILLLLYDFLLHKLLLYGSVLLELYLFLTDSLIISSATFNIPQIVQFTTTQKAATRTSWDNANF